MVAGLLFFLLLALVLASAEKIADIHPQGYVTDLAGVIDAGTRQKLEALCYEVEQKTGAQIGIVTVKSLDGDDVDSYAADLYKHLGIGSKKSDRGVLLLVAPTDRRYRVEVGYGLEPILTDARAGDIGRAMVPFLRQNNYSAAVSNATGQIAQIIAADKGVTLTGAIAPTAAPVDNNSGIGGWWILLIIVGIFLVLRLIGRASRNNFRGGGGRRGGPGIFWIPPMGGGGWGGGGFGGGSGGGGFGGFGGGMSGGGGASGGW